MSERAPVRSTRRRGNTAAATALALLATGGILFAIGACGPKPAVRGDAGTSNASRSDRPPILDRTEPAPAMERSEPVAIDIPAIDVHASMMRLGLRDDGSLEVPPHEPDSRAGWYTQSPTPGERGPAVILGHVDSDEYGPAVFYKLTNLRPGDEVIIARADGSTAEFRVDRTVRYAKDEFPTLEVYGNTDTAQLRLITCGGQFNFSDGSYEDNIVTYATLTTTQPP